VTAWTTAASWWPAGSATTTSAQDRLAPVSVMAASTSPRAHMVTGTAGYFAAQRSTRSA